MSVVYFPQGTYVNTAIENVPVASVKLVKQASAKTDPLFSHITNRQSNKRTYEDKPLSTRQLDDLANSFDHAGIAISLTNDAGKRQELATILSRAMVIETSDKARDAETVAMFRFNDEEFVRYRDGFGVAQSGRYGIMKFIAETFFLDRAETEADSTGFGAQAVQMTTDQTNSAAAFGWLTTATNTRLDQVLAGRAYERVNLKATELGMAMHPLSQVLQEYADMAELQRAFLSYLEIPDGHTVQMLFRLGYAESVKHSARRFISDILRG